MLAGKIADATGSYTTAYYIAAALLIFAAFLAMFSYINISVNIPEREVTIKIGKKKLSEAD
jgi:heme/copper-type cytochrome/quinol oxidase subunit 3